ncbi:tyrosine-type recombinase/integrase [Acinetobacter faecalis]|uniref:tyrosine-type recombinase/integrase n=1 Tax=Acinetobacter faecalis TaxID=2665161 RepID=UPI002A911EDE|nr:integrase family protein [Acinetobacter faecalis]MDY6488440.1 integrase family protein [Acinetobacter faecalis]
MPLTDTWLKKNLGKARVEQHVEPDRDGLSVRVSPKGKITFQMRFRYEGKQARLDLGSYPNLTLLQARKELQKMKGVLEAGQDPRVYKKLEAHKVTNALTFKELYLEWHEKYCMANKKNSQQQLRSFELYVFPKYGSLPADQITLHMWLELLEGHFEKSPSITDRLLTNTKQCLDWGLNRRLIENNPIRHITGKRDLNIKKNKVDRILEDDEVALIWKICDESRMALKNALFIKICLFYANRYSELRMAKKTDFDFERKIWTVPPENHKTGKYTKRPLLRPILPEIEPFIQQAMELNSSIYMFVNNGTKEMYGQNGPGKLPYNVMQYARRHYGVEMKHWSMHDLRRTARTHFSRFTSRDIAELMIGHTMPGEQGTYDYHDYQNEMGIAYKQWWDKLESLTN